MRILHNVNQVYSFLNISKTPDPLPIESICINSKQVSKHSLFFGLPGRNIDGSKYFEEALAKEAALCIIKHGFTDQKNHIAIKLGGYLTIIKPAQDYDYEETIFTIDKTRLIISEKIKQSFDPKRVFNPGKMYRGV